MKTSLFQWILLLAACVAFAQGDFSDFEKSLMGGESSAKPAGSDSSASSSFEESLMDIPSDMEPIYKAREELLAATKSKDTVGVRNAVAQLSEMESHSVIPVRYVELQEVYIETRMFGRLLDMLVEYYKTLLDSTRFDKNPSVAQADGLSLFVANSLSKRDSTRNVYFFISDKIDNARMSDAKKQKLEMFLLLRDAYRDSGIGQRVLELSSRYVKNNSDDPDAKWIEKCIYGPLSRMNIHNYTMLKRDERKEDVIQEKLYSGGFGFNLFFIKGGLGFGFDRLYRSDLFEPVDPFINAELYFQIKRFAVSLEMVSSGVEGVFSYGLGLGWAVYDSRYFKIRPYFEIATTGMELQTRDDVQVLGLYPGDDEMYGFIEDCTTYTAAVNVDFKFGTPYFLFSSSTLTSFSVVSKFGISFVEVNDDVVSGSGVSLFFDIGLGIYFW